MKGAAGYPVFLDLRHGGCVVIGGGEVALRKTESLLGAGAVVTVVAPQLCPPLRELAQQGRVRHLQKQFTGDDLNGMRLAIAATEKPEVNQEVHRQATEQGVLVNVVDAPELCSFITPAVINRDPVTIAIGSGGAAPMLARSLRAKLEAYIPGAYGDMAALMEKTRGLVKQRYPDLRHRRRFWEMVLDGPVMELVSAGKQRQAETLLRETSQRQQVDVGGEVYLVGGGPGDPDLLTFKAMRLMQQADIVLYDRLVAPEILQLVRRDAERFYVGKEKDVHSVPQEEINKYLVRMAQERQQGAAS